MIQMKTFRLWVSVLAALVCMTIGATAHASHFRYGNITWAVPDPVGAPQTVKFTVTAGWRDTLADSITLNFGDATNATAAGTQIGSGTDAAGGNFSVWTYSFTHTYVGAGPFTAFFESCCRVSNLGSGQNDQDFHIETVVSLTSGNTGGPVAQMPSIIQLQNGALRTFAIPVFDPDADAVSCVMSTPAQAGGALTPAVMPPVLNGASPTVSPSCVLSWNLTGVAANQRAAVSIRVSSSHGGVASVTTLDFMVEIVAAPPPTCSGSGSFTIGVGQPFTNTLTGTVVGLTLTTNQSGAPAASSFSPPIGTITVLPPASTTFSWTPTAADVGTRIVLVGFRTITNLTGYCSMTLTVPTCAGFGNVCTAGVGACQTSGTIVCIGATPTCSAVAGTPTPEVCDGVDNNCNGSTDEGNPGGGAVCNSGLLGICSVGTTACQAGVLNCNANTAPGTVAETCDGTDQDCDGTIDDGFNVGTSCTNGVGACQTTGAIVCDGSGGATCNAVPGAPTTETCDGIDNDCDGTADNGFNLGMTCMNGVGACQSAGQIVCDGSGGATCDAVPGAPSTELCGDAIDSDCDGFDSNGCPCGSDTDCQLCNEQYELCVTPCATNTDCPTGQICDEANGHLCVPACTSDADCPLACDLVSGECVECAADADCPMDQGCDVAGYCTPTCQNAGDCTLGTCDTGAGLCVACDTSADCNTGEACSPESHTCILPCNLEADCNTGFICNESHGDCVECVLDGDCPTGACDAFTNTCVECVDDGDCPTGVCDTGNHTCVECIDDGDCANGVCDTTTNTCVDCNQDSDCPNGQLCDEPNHTCVDCLETTDCPDGTVCDPTSHTCEPPCSTDADCPQGVCDPTNGTCVECLDNTDCKDGETCDLPTHTCVPPMTGCTNDNTCSIGEVCDTDTSACIPGCRLSGTGNGCPDGDVCLEAQGGGPIGQCGKPTTPDTDIVPSGGGLFDCTASSAPVGDSDLPIGFVAFAGVSVALFRRRKNRKNKKAA